MTAKGQLLQDISGCQPFPPDTRGVLYYHLPRPKEPILSGQLRFRLCQDPSAFQEGSDLLAANRGEPWSVSLYYLVKLKRMKPLLNLILEEGLVARRVVGEVEKLPTVRSDCPQLYSIDWPFVVDFSSNKISLGLINLSMFEHVTLDRIFRSGKDVSPYAGSAKVRFELSTLPEHEGTPVLVLRFLELLEPIRHLIPNAEQVAPVPEAGSLFYKSSRGGLHHKGLPKPWKYRLNNQPLGDVFKPFIESCKREFGA
ncbi:hypothetical protein NLJ89_g2743 [Agrocybe chaxingu]|uniref:Uncharacterized protein n=1 Tax=Agrocybe chaxingu TaxID=84603 RepID=A0A9W8KBY4_9AGAR|nr:hypothetical protein NLJ89_g2743 [Agrocybe chaxingu]